MSNVLIVGGSSGVGFSLSRILARKASNVYATYHQHPQEDETSLEYHPLNVLDEEFELDFLPEVLDGLVYCPGSIDLKPFNRIKAEAFKSDLDLNLIGAIKVIQAVLPRLKKSAQASVVLFSTIAVQQGFNFHSKVAVSKGAVEGLTKALAAEFAPKIRVNAIAPSLTNTPLAAKLLSNESKVEANDQRHPLKRIGQPEDIAEMAAFLLSEKSSWVSGQILHVDGGMSSLKV